MSKRMFPSCWPARTELGAELRKMFAAPAGKVLVDADYSQIELRLLAHMAGDQAMIDGFKSGEAPSPQGGHIPGLFGLLHHSVHVGAHPSVVDKISVHILLGLLDGDPDVLGQGRLVEEEMEGVAALSVPLLAETHAGKTWAEAH
mgnify:CR=1 FL=1